MTELEDFCRSRPAYRHRLTSSRRVDNDPWPSDMQKDEEFQNRALAGLLTDYGVQTDFEQRVCRRKLDADVDGIVMVLEAETGFHRMSQAINDADARLKQELAVAVFAVCYPADVNWHNLAQSTTRAVLCPYKEVTPR